MTLGRTLAIWLGSLLAIGVILVFYAGVGLVPILVAGAVTLALTLGRYYQRRRKE